jgi:hypothetical protein
MTAALDDPPRFEVRRREQGGRIALWRYLR